ncbi:hypothetical protein MPTK1_6g06290 [Marchantia polymorpha subsp. ruderalis]|uniref:Uncharacterized protein n=2 Tax=Marchantia polymorpha TaxID=3197 RepID=A0AAF6BP52_MARPO|nr:hypothetical protein MARPO_0097s0015 [Marchantia polymorpha]BBN13786.1 hypothetical protein Mp_6g06290 [Marchantia polymorpha subsp. ruderalis]|eukprot:PTQ32528.1 hypothetical protein MARPO_0097s0015 [Marchantia polymorpha]
MDWIRLRPGTEPHSAAPVPLRPLSTFLPMLATFPTPYSLTARSKQFLPLRSRAAADSYSRDVSISQYKRRPTFISSSALAVHSSLGYLSAEPVVVFKLVAMDQTRTYYGEWPHLQDYGCIKARSYCLHVSSCIAAAVMKVIIIRGASGLAEVLRTDHVHAELGTGNCSPRRLRLRGRENLGPAWSLSTGQPESRALINTGASVSLRAGKHNEYCLCSYDLRNKPYEPRLLFRSHRPSYGMIVWHAPAMYFSCELSFVDWVHGSL